MARRIDLDWTLGHSASLNTAPASTYPAEVPGAAQLDHARAEGWGPWWHGENWKEFGWMEDVHWWYSCVPPQVELAPDECLDLVAEGVDYASTLRVDGQALWSGVSIFSGVRAGLGGKEQSIEIVVHPAPKFGSNPDRLDEGRRQASHSAKPPVSYHWDFHPRLIPLGLWKPAYLQVRHKAQPVKWSAYVRQLAEGDWRVDVRLLGADFSAGSISLVLSASEGAEVTRLDNVKSPSVELVVKNPELWWPHTHGKPTRYTLSLIVLDVSGSEVGRLEKKIGFRTVELRMNRGEWNRALEFPKGRNRAPMQLAINGREIFCKGTNWVMPDCFPGTMTEQRYRDHLTLAKDAGFELVRCWGGAAVPHDSFFEIADELGLMIWQEFPLACNPYPNEPQYLAELRSQADAILTDLRHHPCIALWCGGNELFNNWSRNDDQSKALRLLNALCLQHVPDHPFLATSPLEGVSHGGYGFRHSEELTAHNMFDRSGSTAYCEFGCGGVANLEVIREAIPEGELWPIQDGSSWSSHAGDAWLGRATIEHYFGPCESLEDLVERGQTMQAEGYKQLFEEARRQKPYCAMALNWCFNEPWPNVANGSLLCYPARPKPGYRAVQEACRPVLASAKLARFDWRPGSEFEAGLWLLNDSPDAAAAGSIRVSLRLGESEVVLGIWEHPESGEGENIKGPTFRTRLPEELPERMSLVLDCEHHPERSSVYTIVRSRR